MAGALPRNRKPTEQLRRRNPPEQWTALPVEGCRIRAPKWPLEEQTDAQKALWRKLWRLPVASWWHEQQIEPHVIAAYVVLVLTRPEHAQVLALARELGLTPAAMQRMRLFVEQPEPEEENGNDPYAHLKP